MSSAEMYGPPCHCKGLRWRRLGLRKCIRPLASKVKFWAEATCRVTSGRDGKRSIGLELQDGVDGPWIPVGNVAVPVNRAIPEAGSLVEVQYLYAYPGESLFQPIFKKIRDDITEEAAQMNQLKYAGHGERETGGPDIS